jgi:hypothetical protein
LAGCFGAGAGAGVWGAAGAGCGVVCAGGFGAGCFGAGVAAAGVGAGAGAGARTTMIVWRAGADARVLSACGPAAVAAAIPKASTSSVAMPVTRGEGSRAGAGMCGAVASGARA